MSSVDSEDQHFGVSWSTSCEICGGEMALRQNLLQTSDRRRGIQGSWSLSECSRCTVISLLPKPTNDQLDTYYSSYSEQVSLEYSTSAGAKHPVIRKLYHWLSGDVDPRDFIEHSKSTRILDYGCGYGVYLNYFRERGLKTFGVEVAQSVVDNCRSRGLDVRASRSDGIVPFDDDVFDVVYLMQVLEHLPEPRQFLQELFRLVCEGGSVYIAVPNSKSIWRSVFAASWVSGWFAPFHLFHYSETSLRSLLSDAGFHIEWVRSRTPESWFRLNLKAALYPKDSALDKKRTWLDTSLAKYALMPVLRIMELPFRQKDCVFVKATKRL